MGILISHERDPILTMHSQGWMAAIEGVFDDEEELQKRHRSALEFAAKRREKGWRLTHSELYDVNVRR